jgi:hypothetical protein
VVLKLIACTLLPVTELSLLLEAGKLKFCLLVVAVVAVILFTTQVAVAVAVFFTPY